MKNGDLQKGDNGNFDNVYVPKMAEDAVMTSILYNLSKIRQAAGAVAPVYKREAYAKKMYKQYRIIVDEYDGPISVIKQNI